MPFLGPYRCCGEGEEIRYVDVTSLYPWVNKNCTYPIGHPQIITQPDDQSIHSYFGLALVDILPPARLFHPVLPVRSGQKLTFPLCRSCVREEQAKPMLDRIHYCHHSDAAQDLVHARVVPSRGPVVHYPSHTRSLAFSSPAASDGSFCRVCQYLAENQARIGRLALHVSDPRTTPELHFEVPGARGHPPGHSQHRQKSRVQGHCQVDAE